MMTEQERARILTVGIGTLCGLWNQTCGMDHARAPFCRLTFHGGQVVEAPPAEWFDLLRPVLTADPRVRFRPWPCGTYTQRQAVMASDPHPPMRREP